MKKLICLALCVVLMVSSATAFAYIDYTLLEKWQRQVAFGNGIKGTLVLNVSGEAEWAKLLAPVSGVPVEIRAIHEGNAFQYRAYAQKGEEVLGLSQLYGDGQAVYLKSDLLPEVLLALPTGGDLLHRLSGAGESDAPALYSAMMNIINVPETTWKAKWRPALEAYETALEMWMENYASAPSVKRTEDGSATVLVRYDIPAEAVKSQLKALCGNMLQDAVLLPLLKDQLSPAQQEAYLNPHLKYYYDQVIDGLKLNGNVVLEREMTAKGEPVRTQMSFPLSQDGWTEWKISQTEKNTTFDVQGDGKQIVLDIEQIASNEGSTSYQGKVRLIPAEKEKKAFAAAFTLVEVLSNSKDDDGRSHDVSNWTLSIKPDEAHTGEGWSAPEPMDIMAKVHMHSKALQSNAVTIETDVTVKLADAQITADLDLMTRSKWVLDELPTEGAQDISTMKEDDLAQIFTDLGMNGLTVLMMAKQETPAATEEPAATVEPTAQPTAEPAPEMTEVPAQEAAQ